MPRNMHGIGLAQHHVRAAPGGLLQRGANGPAIHQHGRLVGRADPIRMRGDEGFAFADPIGRAAEPRERQLRVEPDQHRIRLVAGAVGRQRKPGAFQLPAHAGRAEHEQPPHRRHLLPQILDGRLGGGVKLVGGRRRCRSCAGARGSPWRSWRSCSSGTCGRCPARPAAPGTAGWIRTACRRCKSCRPCPARRGECLLVVYSSRAGTLRSPDYCPARVTVGSLIAGWRTK